MGVTISSQVYVFFSCILGGMLIGILFDVFRLSRKFVNTKDVVTYVEDLVFWILVGIIVLMTVFYTNNGQIRGYVFLGLLIGAVFYFLIFSRIIVKTLTHIIEFLKNIIVSLINMVKVPIKIAVRIMSRPVKYMNNKLCVFIKFTGKIWTLVKTWILKIKRTRKIIKEKI